MGYIGEEKRQGNVPADEPLVWPTPEKEETPAEPEKEKVTA